MLYIYIMQLKIDMKEETHNSWNSDTISYKWNFLS